MPALYRKRFVLPSLVHVLLLSACDATPPPQPSAPPASDTHLEVLQEIEALKHGIEEHRLEQQRIDALLGSDQAPVR